LCHAQALGVPEDQLPDCDNGDDECWSDFWASFFTPEQQ
jgi:hypothetical protein